MIIYVDSAMLGGNEKAIAIFAIFAIPAIFAIFRPEHLRHSRNEGVEEGKLKPEWTVCGLR